MTAESIIEIKHLKTYLGNDWVHDDLSLSVERGEILAIVGGSGSGKTTLLRAMLGLNKPTSGRITIFDKDLIHADAETRLSIEKRWGVLFQQNALFSSLTLLENVAFPLHEQSHLDLATINALASLKINMVGLPTDSGLKYPAELSGGMQKRAGLARALVLDPELIFLDEPTAGLDPNMADGFDDLLLRLQETMDLTIVMITHDLNSLWKVAHRVAFLAEGKVVAVGTMTEMVKNQHPLIQAFFNGPRGKAIKIDGNER